MPSISRNMASPRVCISHMTGESFAKFARSHIGESGIGNGEWEWCSLILSSRFPIPILAPASRFPIPDSRFIAVIEPITVTCYDNSMATPRRRGPGRPPTGRALTAAERMQRYRVRQRASGLRATTRWQSGTTAPLTPGLLKHRMIEARSLAMHCLIARKIEAEPALLDIARRNIESWRARYGNEPPRALEEWRAILARPWPEVAAIIMDPGETGARLRQSSPFAGVLTPSERKRVYEAFGS